MEQLPVHENRATVKSHQPPMPITSNQWLRPCGGEPYPVMKGLQGDVTLTGADPGVGAKTWPPPLQPGKGPIFLGPGPKH